MDTVFDVLQAAGIGAAVGIRPFLPALLVAALAAGDLGIDFDGTDWSFLEQPPFLLAILALLVIADLLRRRAGEDVLDDTPGLYALIVLSASLGFMFGAGTMADHGESQLAGMIVGTLCALLAIAAIRPLFARVRSRLDQAAASLLPMYREALGLATAGLSVLFPPLAAIVVAALIFLLAGGRRREGEKYAGLRILR